MLDRRAFLAGLALTMPALALRGQSLRLPAERPRRLALIAAGHSVDMLDEAADSPCAVLLRELHGLGRVEGQTLTVERWALQAFGSPAYAEQELYRLAGRIVDARPDVIFVGGTALAQSLTAATATIPIVFCALSPREAGLVENLAHPGGNVTGIACDARPQDAGKAAELLLDCRSNIARMLFLGTQADWDGPIAERVRATARRTTIPVTLARVEPPLDAAAIRRALMPYRGLPDQALFTSINPDQPALAEIAAELALAAGWPTGGLYEALPQAGLLLSYGSDQYENFRAAAGYIDQILRGTPAADLPVKQPSGTAFVINGRTARALNLSLPPWLLSTATRTIE